MKLTNTAKPAGIFSIAVALALPMCAQVNLLTSWVASNGVDSPVCGIRSAPCATFQRAQDNAAIGGIVRAVDAGDFGTLNITKSITIDGTGSGATIVGSVALASNLAANTPVTIRGLSINGRSGVPAAILILSGYVHLENVSVTAPQGVSNGVLVTGGTLTASHLTVIGGDNNGITINGVTASIRDSVFQKSTRGITVVANNGLGGTAMIERCEFSFNSVGIEADGSLGPATVRVSDSVITANTATGLSPKLGGVIISFGTNMVDGNFANGAPSAAASLQ